MAVINFNIDRSFRIMKMKNILYFLAFTTTFLFISCSQQQSGFTGELAGAENLSVYLDMVKVDKMKSITKTESKGNGTFAFELEEPLEAGIYRVRAGKQRAYLILNGDEKNVHLSGDLADLKKFEYEISGSPASERIRSTMFQLNNGTLKESDVQELISSTDNTIEALHYAMIGLSPSEGNLKLMKEVADRLKSELPESDYASSFSKQIVGLERQIMARRAQERIKVGELAPDIELPNPDGDVMRLSDLKGQVVLLDFWASWCGPCRRANPHVVKTYNKYKDKGFTVFSVSLDRPGQKGRWVQAIEKDNLAWPYHVSDLQFWSSAPAQTYGVKGIPKTFLIGKDGKIISNSVSPYALDAELEKLL